MSKEMIAMILETANRRLSSAKGDPTFFKVRIAMKSPYRLPAQPVIRHGFTLVEILIVVVIVGMLAAFVVPASMRAIQRARETEAKMEVSALADAVQQYQQKYGDYPPDGSDWQVLKRHMRKVFPRMQTPDTELLTQLTHPNGTDFSFVAMDRAEALVFFLGGFSSDIAHPLTGPGGPLETDQANQGSADLSHYQYNATRDNVIFEFKPERLTFKLVGGRYISTDEDDMGFTGNELDARGRNDLLPAYRSTRAKTPIVYFDSRTYGEVAPGVYNGFLASSEFGGLRPYKTEVGAQLPDPAGDPYGSVGAAFRAVKFHNPDTFQIISPGGDGVYGVATTEPDNSLPIHFVTQAGDAVVPNENATDLAGLAQFPTGPITKYQDRDLSASIDVNGHLDNVTNFSSSTLESDLP